MRFDSSRILLFVFAALVLAGAQGCTKAEGMGQYCSVTGAAGDWDFTWTGKDPCGDILERTLPGGAIQRAGLYSLRGENRVVLRCDGGFVSTHRGVGTLAMSYARNVIAQAQGLSGCVFTVAPKEMPVFERPFEFASRDLQASLAPGTGFDFARWPYMTLNLQDFGQIGPVAATVVNHHADDRGGMGFIDDHDAYDWGMPRQTPLYAVALGRVLKARNFNTSCSGSDSPTQGEVYIEHRVYGDATAPARYHEKFFSGYFHLASLSVADGDIVQPGQLIGYSGNTGCSSGPHLHFAVGRLTNTANRLEDTITIDANGNDGWRLVIDPYGFDSVYGFDPWGVGGFNWSVGALSIDLWRPGEDPPTGAW